VFNRLVEMTVALFFCLAGCAAPVQSNDVKEIHTVIASRAAALNARDTVRYLAAISQRYNDKGKDFARLRESITTNFRDTALIAYQADPLTVTVTGATAEAHGSYRMRVKTGSREISLNGTEHLKLVKEPDGWKIIAGI
jgi:ketosteroid isomerase-like protein